MSAFLHMNVTAVEYAKIPGLHEEIQFHLFDKVSTSMKKDTLQMFSFRLVFRWLSNRVVMSIILHTYFLTFLASFSAILFIAVS